jgi:hypothetical protein
MDLRLEAHSRDNGGKDISEAHAGVIGHDMTAAFRAKSPVAHSRLVEAT